MLNAEQQPRGPEKKDVAKTWQRVLALMKRIRDDQGPEKAQQVIDQFLEEEAEILRGTDPETANERTAASFDEFRNELTDNAVNLGKAEKAQFNEGDVIKLGDKTIKVGELLGQGGQGKAMRARLSIEGEKEPRDIVIKVLEPTNFKEVNNAIREARILNALSKGDKLTEREGKATKARGALDYFGQQLIMTNEGQKLVLMMEDLKDGDELGEMLDKGELDGMQKMQVIRDFVADLRKVHKDVAHEDLKPANIFVQRIKPEKDNPLHPGVRARLIDYGISRIIDSPQAKEEGMSGSPLYFDPAKMEGKPVEDIRKHDIYQTGVILFEICFGKEAFYHYESSTDLFFHIASQKNNLEKGFSIKEAMKYARTITVPNAEMRDLALDVMKLSDKCIGPIEKRPDTEELAQALYGKGGILTRLREMRRAGNKDVNKQWTETLSNFQETIDRFAEVCRQKRKTEDLSKKPSTKTTEFNITID